MYVIMETGGKQYKVQQGDELFVEKLDAEAGETVEISKVLALGQESGFTVGKPYVQDAKVMLKIIEHGKGEKILVFKYKPKKKYRKLRGHRQPYSKVLIDQILIGGEAQD
jgi:large subunit ribosomal protein L21